MKKIILYLVIVTMCIAQPTWTNFAGGVTIQNNATQPNASSCNNGGSSPTVSCTCSNGPYLYTSGGSGYGGGDRIIAAWGGAFGRKKSGFESIFILGGGHVDGVDDRVVILNMAGYAKTLSIAFGPSFVNNTVTCATNVPYNALTVTPRSRHVFYNIDYSTSSDKAVMFSGGIGYSGQNFNDTWILDVSPSPSSTPIWSSADPTNCGSGCGGAIGQPIQLYTGSPASGTPDNYMAYDSVSDKFYILAAHNPLYQYDITTNTMRNASNANGSLAINCLSTSGCPSAFVDNINHKFWVFGGGVAANWDISSSALTAMLSGTKLPFTLATGGVDSSCNALLNAQGPGLQFISGTGKVLGYIEQTGGQVITLDPTTLTCTTATLGGSTPANGTNASGLYGRFQCFTTLGSSTSINPTCVEVNDWNVAPSFFGPSINVGLFPLPSSINH